MYNRALDKKILKELGTKPAPVPILRKFIPQDTGWLATYKDGGQWMDEYQTGGQRSKPTVNELTNILNYIENPPPRNLNPTIVGTPPVAPVLLSASNTRPKALKAAGKKIEDNRKAAEIRQLAISKAVEEEKQGRVSERLSAQKAYKGKTEPFMFPNGETKTYDQMDWRERRYVGSKSLEADTRFVEDDESWWDTFSPISWIGSMAASLGQSPYEAREMNSVVPYVSSIATPLLMGRGLGAKSINPVSKSFWKNTELTDAQFAKTLINPLYGFLPGRKQPPPVNSEVVSRSQGMDAIWDKTPGYNAHLSVKPGYTPPTNDKNLMTFETSNPGMTSFTSNSRGTPTGNVNIDKKLLDQLEIERAAKDSYHLINRGETPKKGQVFQIPPQFPLNSTDPFEQVMLQEEIHKLNNNKVNAKKLSIFKNQMGGPIVTENGYKNGVPPKGSNWRIPGDTLYNPTGFKIWAQPNKGEGKWLDAYNTNDVKFPGADYVDEYHMKKYQMGGKWLNQYNP